MSMDRHLANSLDHWLTTPPDADWDDTEDCDHSFNVSPHECDHCGTDIDDMDDDEPDEVVVQPKEQYL